MHNVSIAKIMTIPFLFCCKAVLGNHREPRDPKKGMIETLEIPNAGIPKREIDRESTNT